MLTLLLMMESSSVSAGSMISSILSDPRGALAFIVQLLLGIGLGYYSIKIVKYLLALISILVIGIMLNAWSLSHGSVKSTIQSIGEEWSKVYPVLKSLAAALGILTIGPTALGFFIGIVLAMRK